MYDPNLKLNTRYGLKVIEQGFIRENVNILHLNLPKNIDVQNKLDFYSN